VSKKPGGETERSGRLAIVVLAAGESSGPGSRRPMAMRSAGGRTLLGHVITAARRVVAPSAIFTVLDREGERARNALSDTGVQFLDLGTRGNGAALQGAGEALSAFKHILLLPNDASRIRPETLEQLWRLHESGDAAMTLLAAKPDDVHRENRNFGICAIRTGALLAHLDQFAPHNEDPEDSIAGLATLMRAAGERVVTQQAADASEAQRVNTILELVALDRSIRNATAIRLLAAGVIIFRPDTCLIDADVEVEPEAVIDPFVQLLGRTRIGAESHIRSYSIIEDCTLGSRVLVLPGCIMTDSSVADGARIGPYSHLRPGSMIGEEAHVGNFVETKKTRLGKGAKANHLAYLGDTEVGALTNIGAGVITCNYDGAHKHLTRIGEGVFVGSDSTLVAPIAIEDGAYIGAGSCITKDVPAGALAVGRSRQVTKEGWATARRARRRGQESK
jgi:bifunctional UDP-N-acetylglucosamine pyrophosphorylase/glucosamine-1-phosphate N-acetyltransferase